MESISRRLFVYDSTNSIRFLIDTGAQVSVIPKSMCKDPKKDMLVLSAANGASIETFGLKELTLDLGTGKHFQYKFIIASVDNPIIGADFLYFFGLVLDIRNRKLLHSSSNTEIQCAEQATTNPNTKLFFIKNEYENILLEFQSIRKPLDCKQAPKHNVQHYIETNGELPVCRPRRLNLAKLKIAKEAFQNVVATGICRPSSSSISSPLHMVPKKQSNE